MMDENNCETRLIFTFACQQLRMDDEMYYGWMGVWKDAKNEKCTWNGIHHIFH